MRTTQEKLPKDGDVSVWGDIGGSLSDQTDLQTALNNKADALGTDDNYMTDAEKTKLSGIETGADVTDATNVAAAGAVMESDTSTASMSFVIDEDDMASDSATKVPTQQSVKKYVDDNAGGGGASYNAGTAQRSGGSTGNQTIAHGLGVIPKLFKLTCIQRNGNTGFAKSVGVIVNGTDQSLVYESSFETGQFDSAGGARLALLYSGKNGVFPKIFYADSVTVDETNVVITWAILQSPSTNTIDMLWEAYA